MWTFANALRVVNEECCEGDGRNMSEFSASFENMVYAGETLYTQLRHIHLLSGERHIEVISTNSSGQVVLRGKAVTSIPHGMFVFTGQGSASVGMGMELYNTSITAKKIWDKADQFLLFKYGFSILDIVKNNPKRVTVRFGSKRGQNVRENYLKLVCKDPGTSEVVPVIPEISSLSASFTFFAENGLLYATQFQQPALVLMELTAFFNLRDCGVLPSNFAFAGHSLGEYAALASVAEVLSVDALIELVFIRGLVMQRSVSRDARGRSDFGMVAASPMRVSPQMNCKQLQELVDGIMLANGGKLCEIVNFNVPRSQYVVAGHLESLHALGAAMSAIAKQPMKFSDRSLTTHMVAQCVEEAKTLSVHLASKNEKIQLERGKATIPLRGIDVPFHSSYLSGGVPIFREQLLKKMPRSVLTRKTLKILENRYIPNVVAIPFSTERTYVELVKSATKSEWLTQILNDDEKPKTPEKSSSDSDEKEYVKIGKSQDNNKGEKGADKKETSNDFSGDWSSEEKRLDVAYALLVELLAFQFASPVQWVKTQRLLLSNPKGRRYIEIGPAATLSNMALNTLKFGLDSILNESKVSERCQILFLGKDQDTILYINEDQGMNATEYAISVNETFKESNPQQDNTPNTLETAKQILNSPAVVTPTNFRGQTQQIQNSAGKKEDIGPISNAQSLSPQPTDDTPASIGSVIQVLLSLKLKQPLVNIKDDTTINALCGGKSALQNEIVGDLHTEFGASNVPDDAAELPLSKLAEKLKNGGYTPPGKLTDQLVSKSLRKVLPGGFSKSMVQEWLASEFHIGKGFVFSVLLHSLLTIPQKRAQNEDSAKAWLRNVAIEFQQYHSVTFGVASAAATSSGSGDISALLVALMGQNGITASDGTKQQGVCIKDEALSAICFIRSLLAFKLKQPFVNIKDDTTINALCGGKSALQNEIVGDLHTEFGASNVPDDAAELPLSKLADKLKKYNSYGSLSTKLISRHVCSKMPVGFSLKVIREYVSEQYNIGPGRIDAILLIAITKCPQKRIPDENAAHQFIDATVELYAQDSRITLNKGNNNQGGSGVPSNMLHALSRIGGGGANNPLKKELKSLQKRLELLATDTSAAFAHFYEPENKAAYTLRESQRVLHQRVSEMEGMLHEWENEFDNEMLLGVSSVFDPKKVRFFSSYWNEVLLDALELFHAFSASKLSTREALLEFATAKRPLYMELRHSLTNRPTNDLINLMNAYCERAKKDGHTFIATGVKMLLDVVQSSFKSGRGEVPFYISHFMSTKPSSSYNEKGNLIYQEVPRPGVTNVKSYILEMKRSTQNQKVDESIEIITNSPSKSENQKLMNSIIENCIEPLHVDDSVIPTIDEVIDAAFSKNSFLGPPMQKGSAIYRYTEKRMDLVRRMRYREELLLELPFLNIRSKVHGKYFFDRDKTSLFYKCFDSFTTTGVSWHDKVALVTGCGKGSIAIEVVKSLLQGGCIVIVTSSSAFKYQGGTNFFEKIYKGFGAAGSRLILAPFNACSIRDINGLVQFVYNDESKGGLGLDIDFILPFAALGERGDISSIGSRSELAHRAMLTNVVRLLGEIRKAKSILGSYSRPALCILPLSPNHGSFGGDGLYAESKLGLEALLEKWTSESWGEEEGAIGLAGVVIGWTRGTGLMNENNLAAEGVEELDIRTFSTVEMAANLTCLLHPLLCESAQREPLWADFGGGFNKMQPSAKKVVADIRKRQKEAESLTRAVIKEKEASVRTHVKNITGVNTRCMWDSNIFPALPTKQRLGKLRKTNLEGMLDLSSVVVVCGYGEIGPWGSSKTRWDMEVDGTFSIESCIELAWLTGRIRSTTNAAGVSSWVDTISGETIMDFEIKKKYENDMINNSGIRVIEVGSTYNKEYDPSRKSFCQNVAIERDLCPVEVGSFEEAEQYRREAGDKADIWQTSEGQWMLQLRRGAVLTMRRALQFDRFVAGQIPKGWDAKTFGVPDDIINQVDPVTLYALVSTAEALISAGIDDPYEFYEYVHVSQIGNTSGSGLGGAKSLRGIFRERWSEEKPVQGDVLQESFINTMPAWINLLLLSASGPIKTPVAACATAAVSVELGVQTIVSGKAKVVVVGGYDDFGEEASFEFAQMGATVSSVKDREKGYFPREASRPCTDSRSGFLESHGAGIQLLVSADLALQMHVLFFFNFEFIFHTKFCT